MWQANYKEEAELDQKEDCKKDQSEKEEKNKEKIQDDAQLNLYIDEVFPTEIFAMIVERIHRASMADEPVGIAGAIRVKPFSKAITLSPHVRFWNCRLGQALHEQERQTIWELANLVPKEINEISYEYTINPTYQDVRQAYVADDQLTLRDHSSYIPRKYFFRLSMALQIASIDCLLSTAILFFGGVRGVWIFGIPAYLAACIGLRGLMVIENKDYYEVFRFLLHPPKIERVGKQLNAARVETMLFGLQQRFEYSDCSDYLKELLENRMVKILELFTVISIQTIINAMPREYLHGGDFFHDSSYQITFKQFLDLQKHFEKLKNELIKIGKSDEHRSLIEKIEQATCLTELETTLEEIKNLFDITIEQDKPKEQLENMQARMWEIKVELEDQLKDLLEPQGQPFGVNEYEDSASEDKDGEEEVDYSRRGPHF